MRRCTVVAGGLVAAVVAGMFAGAPAAAAGGPQLDPPSWGLDRIDQRGLPLDGGYRYPNDGAGVRVYVFGTGIRLSHRDFGSRAVSGADVIDNDGDASDCNGNGTHLAGTVGGGSYGVAKQAPWSRCAT